MNQRQITEKSLMEKKLREARVSAAVLKNGQVSLCTHPQLPKKQLKDCPRACREGAAVHRGVPTSLHSSPLNDLPFHGSHHTRPAGLRQRPSVSPTLTHPVWHSLTSPTRMCLISVAIKKGRTGCFLLGLFIVGVV